MIIDTQISFDHLELIKIFIEANDLDGVVAYPQDLNIRGVIHRVISVKSLDEDSNVKLTFLGIRHSGVINMLYDYLLKCGVSPDRISPPTIHRQLQSEREEKQNEEFMAHLTKIKKNENTNK